MARVAVVPAWTKEELGTAILTVSITAKGNAEFRNGDALLANLTRMRRRVFVWYVLLDTLSAALGTTRSTNDFSSTRAGMFTYDNLNTALTELVRGTLRDSNNS